MVNVSQAMSSKIGFNLEMVFRALDNESKEEISAESLEAFLRQ